MRRLLPIVGLCALLATACSASTTGPSTTPSVAQSAGQSAPAPQAIAVPDGFTPVVVDLIGGPTFPFKGSDGKYHVSYDLQLTNASRVPATLTRVQIVDAYRRDRVVGSISGKQLVDPNCAYGDCNRLVLLPSADAPNAQIPAQESRALLVDLVFDSKADVPKAVLHRIYVDGAAGPPAKEPTPIDYLAAPVDISAGTPRVIGAPLRGDNWIAANGCCGTGFPHRPSLNSLNGKLNNSQRFAIDWLQTNADGRFYTGPKGKNEGYVYYGANIYAVADGTITSTLDGIDPGTPGTLPAQDPVLGPRLTVENVDGNHIVENIGGGAYAMYAHLIKGTLLVKPGDRVKKGQVIAKLGNTGNSNAPHLHFQLMNGPSLLNADALPYVIDNFTYEGQVAPERVASADDFLSGTFLQGKLKSEQPRTGELPLRLAIVKFP